MFNQAHQASGQQSRALASGILMYARFIDKLDESRIKGVLKKSVYRKVSVTMNSLGQPWRWKVELTGAR